MLFSLTKDGKALLKPECIKLCPEFRILDEFQILFIVLYCDYYGPFHQFPVEERLRKAKREVYGTKEVNLENDEHVKRGITAYMSLQYDKRRELIKRYMSKIDLLNDAMEQSDDPSKIRGYITAINDLRAQTELLQEEIDKDEEIDLDMQKGKSLSFLEKLQRKRDIFDSKEPVIEVKIIYEPKNLGN